MYTEGTFQNKVTEITEGTKSDLDLYAKWKEIIVAPGQSSISYVLNGGTNHADNPDKYTEGQAAIILKATDGSGVVATCTVTVP